MYLHPDCLQYPNVSFSRKYDYYAYGVMLVEIALWQTIQEILLKHQGLKAKECRRQDAVKIRGILLGEVEDDENYMRQVAFRAGDRYAEVVELCLRGDFGRSPTEDQILNVFTDRVLNKLKSCVI